MLDAALQMIEVWNRLSTDKQTLLLKRFGTQENALAALVTTQMLAPAKS
ncbi:MarR family transcriptional regulator [Pseudomonas fluorescens]